MVKQKDKNKKKQNAKIVTGLIVSTTLVGGAIAGGISIITETKEEKEEEKKNSSLTTPFASKQKPLISADNKQDLKTVLPQNKRNLDIIETNGQPLTADMIKKMLPENIKKEVDITNIQDNKATVIAKANSKTYKGNVEISYTIDNKINLTTIILKSEIGKIDTKTNYHPTVSQLLKGIKKENLTANALTENDFEIRGPYSTLNETITIIGKNKYKGEVYLKYSTKV